MLNYVSVQQRKRKLDPDEDILVFDHMTRSEGNNSEIIFNTTPSLTGGREGLEWCLRRKLY
jgi:hypothetical protein